MLAGLVTSATVFAQATREQPTVPAFPVGVEAITVDVVVVDEDGHPVRGLSREDFTVLEDGTPQSLVGFEAIDASLPATGAAVSAPVAPQRMTTNQSGRQAGRALTLLVDDVGLDAERASTVRETVTRWLRDEARDEDDITLVTSSGDVWWSDRVATGRVDLLAVVESIRGRRGANNSHGPLSEVEAYRIVNEGGRAEGVASSRGVSESGTSSPFEGVASFPTTPASLGTVTDRVAQRWFSQGVCVPGIETPTRCRSRVEHRAREVYQVVQRRARVLLEMIERLSRGFAGRRGRNPVLVFSEGLIHDTQEDAFEEVIDVSRHGNAPIYFIDARGLFGSSTFSAESRRFENPSNQGSVAMEEIVVASGGTERLADLTGGLTIRDTNDLLGGLERIAEESGVYYLLGYQPQRPPDEKWHKLEVRIAREGVDVRARKGYFATPPPQPVSAPDPKPGATRALSAKLLSGGERSELPLRLASYILGPSEERARVKVLVALEVDARTLALQGTGRKRTAHLDLTLVTASRDQMRIVTVDERLEITLEKEGTEGWWTIYRQIDLPPGVAQVRALLADVATDRTGTVSQRIEIPAANAVYLSTPVLSDQLGPALAGRERRVAPVAHRQFPTRGTLYCQYEVYGATGRGPNGFPELTGGYIVRHESGRIVSLGAPSAIAVAADRRVVRRLSLQLDALSPGRYELTLTVADRVSGRKLLATEPFIVASEEHSAP
jgi:VWFA-related protein